MDDDKLSVLIEGTASLMEAAFTEGGAEALKEVLCCSWMEALNSIAKSSMTDDELVRVATGMRIMMDEHWDIAVDKRTEVLKKEMNLC